MALLEADVALPVVRDFIARVKDKGARRRGGGLADAGQALVGIVNRELPPPWARAWPVDINLAAQPPAVILMAGLQGRRQTTTTAKLARAPDREAQEEGADGLGRRLPPGRHRAAQDGDAGRRRVVPVDADRQAAGHRAAPRSTTPSRHYFDVLLVDTAGRLAIDEALMAEIKRAARRAEPGRDAVRGRRDAGPGRGQHREGLQGRALPLTGVVLTKMDGDSRGGRGAVGAPGHRRADQVRRHQREDRRPGGVRRRTPRRPRLGMGDIVALVEQGRRASTEAAQKLAEKVKAATAST